MELTLVELLEVFPFGVPGDVLMGLTVLTALNDHDIVFATRLLLCVLHPQ
jgi:hypothetical protein